MTAWSARLSCIAKARRRRARACLGIIPGSMASPGFVVSGKGNAESLNSASHGAGRAMSRKAANEKFNWKDVNRFLKQQGVTLITAGLDEVPMAYKNIREVMAAQNDLVTVLGEFDAQAGEDGAERRKTGGLRKFRVVLAGIEIVR